MSRSIKLGFRAVVKTPADHPFEPRSVWESEPQTLTLVPDGAHRVPLRLVSAFDPVAGTLVDLEPVVGILVQLDEMSEHAGSWWARMRLELPDGTQLGGDCRPYLPKAAWGPVTVPFSAPGEEFSGYAMMWAHHSLVKEKQ